MNVLRFVPHSKVLLTKVSTTAKSMSTLKGRNLQSILDLSNEELVGLIDHSIDMKQSWAKNPSASRAFQPLKGQSMSMIFQKRSTRTRVSTETGIFMLGGHGLMLGPQDIQLGVNETLKDTSKVLCRFNNIILARVFAHSDIEELCEYSSVPVINALSDKFHPLQTLADLMTLKEHYGDLRGKTLAWVGDGNNVLHDLMVGAIKMGMHVRVATPKGYDADPGVLAAAKLLCQKEFVTLTLTTDPREAVKGANVVVTDTWVSMGQEKDAQQKKIDFAGYQVNKDLMSLAAKEAVFLHCLPRKPEEVSDEVHYFIDNYFFLLCISIYRE